jgi:arylsulfatase A
MKKKLIATPFLILLTVFFAVCSYAAIENCDFSEPRDGYIDGGDLAQFSAYYAAGDTAANVDEAGGVDSADVAHFAGFFGSSYTVTARRPNILLIIADDVGMDVVSDMYPGLVDDLLDKYGQDGFDLSADKLDRIDGIPASTPVLDSLAQQGMRFSNAWAQPFCSPTRATVITGMFIAKHNVKTFDEAMTTNHTTFVKRLHDEAGYSTAVFGKWHLAGGSGSGYTGAKPKQVGFDLYKGNFDAAPTPGYWDHYYHVQDNDTDADEYRTDPTPTKDNFAPDIAPTTYAPVVRAADTIEYITAQQEANPDKPWFVWLAFNLSHVTMRTYSPPIKDYYHVPNADTMNADTLAEISACGGVPGQYYSGNGDGVTECNAAQLNRAMTNAMDTMIGRVLEKVDSIPSDTYVIFIGDNGTWSNNMDNMYGTYLGRGKTTPYESGARVPMVIRGPGITADSQNDEFVHAADLFSTCLEFAGLEVAPEELVYHDYLNNPTELDGVSLAPILFGSASSVRDPELGYLLEEVGWSGTKVGARNATYKVIRQTTVTSNLFYNLNDDPLEEDPLPIPGCEGYDPNSLTRDSTWNYCRLLEVIDNYSIYP